MEHFDIIVIGMGPAGMAASAMASALGLKVLAVEENKVGGECLNCGCIPSKALLKAAWANKISHNLQKYGIRSDIFTDASESLNVVREKVSRISGKKLMQAFSKVKLILDKGYAEFIDEHSIKVDKEIYSAKKIFLAVGTKPFMPPIEGFSSLPDAFKLTNLNLFTQSSIPKTLTIIGGGAIGCEMAQAFSRLGSVVNLIHIDKHLLPQSDAEAAEVLEKRFDSENIKVHNQTKINKIYQKDGNAVVESEKGNFVSEKILIAAGRKPNLDHLNLDKVGIKYSSKGIEVDKYLRTNIKHIYAIGDCNGIALLSHAAMHQGMLALMNAINPLPFKINYRKYLVPWSVFTSPEVAQVGLTHEEALALGKKIVVTKKDYASYGRAIADGTTDGFIKVITDKKGKIYGVTIIGSNASEIIHEWILATQHKLTMRDILMTQHAFPTMSMLNIMVAQDWMMGMVQNTKVQKIVKALFKFSF